MKYVSLFAGIGGFDLALNRLGHECVYANEWDKYAAQIYNKNSQSIPEVIKDQEGRDRPLNENRPNSIRTGYEQPTGSRVDTRDIRTVPTSEIPDHDLLVGGFPCQAFSIAGKRRGFDDTRGTLFFEIARILKDKQPKFFILENVKGLLSHDNGFTFKTIISTLTELGYDLEWQVLNSKNFGVPQNRERVFIVGHLRGQPRPEVFPITECSGTNKGLVYHQKADKEIARVYDPKGISPTLHLKTGGWQEPKILAWSKSHRTGKSDADKRRKNYGQVEQRIKVGEFNTLSTGTGGSSQSTSNFVADETRIRRLTPTECERLQGFPEVEKYCIIEVCKQVNANGVENTLNIKVIDQDNAVQPNVLIDCGENGVEIRSQERLFLNAKNVEKKNWFHPHIKIDDFVQMLVGINTIAEKTIGLGGEVSFLNEQCLTTQKSGKKRGNLSGNEIMLPVGYVENDLITLKELLKSIISNHSDIKVLEQKLTTLSSFVIRAINGYIPSEILNQDIFTIGVKTKVGFTYGISDTQRYKCLGNAVTVNVVYEVARRL
jgi:DNA-cytosine methyltransferase